MKNFKYDAKKKKKTRLDDVYECFSKKTRLDDVYECFSFANFLYNGSGDHQRLGGHLLWRVRTKNHEFQFH